MQTNASRQSAAQSRTTYYEKNCSHIRIIIIIISSVHLFVVFSIAPPLSLLHCVFVRLNMMQLVKCILQQQKNNKIKIKINSGCETVSVCWIFWRCWWHCVPAISRSGCHRCNCIVIISRSQMNKCRNEKSYRNFISFNVAIQQTLLYNADNNWTHTPADWMRRTKAPVNSKYQPVTIHSLPCELLFVVHLPAHKKQ